MKFIEWVGRPLLALAICFSVTLAPARTAHAQDKMQQARDHFNRGTAFFKQGRHEEALKELMQAYVLDPNPLLVYNIARVHEERGDLHNALKYFKNYLTISPKAKNRRAVKKKIRQLKKALKNMPKQGFLSVKTDPPGATVKVNGRLMGQTPVTSARLAAGRYKVEILLDRYQAYRADVVLQGGNSTNMNVLMVDLPSSVLITTTPPGAMATLLAPRRQPLGQCPCVVNLSSGRYKVRVEMQGHRAREFDFVKQPHEQLKVPVSLVPDQTSGKLLVGANVPGAQVIIDGQPVGITPMAAPIDIRLGQVMVEVNAQGHRPWRQTAVVGPQGITQVQAMLVPIQAGVVGLPPTNQPQVVYRAQDVTSAQKSWGWALTGIGIAAVVGGGVGTTLAQLKQREFDDATYFREPQTQLLIRQDIAHIDALALEEEALLWQNVSIGLYAGGGALLLTGIILLATDSGPEMESLAVRPQVLPLNGGAMVLLDF